MATFETVKYAEIVVTKLSDDLLKKKKEILIFIRTGLSDDMVDKISKNLIRNLRNINVRS